MKSLKQIYSNKKLLKQLFWYMVVGVGGTLVDFSVFYLSLHFQSPPVVAQWLASLVGFTHNHMWQHFYVFEHGHPLKKTYLQSLVVVGQTLKIYKQGHHRYNKPACIFLFSQIALTTT